MSNQTSKKPANYSTSLLVESDNDRFTLAEPVSLTDMYQLMLGMLETRYFRMDQLTSPEITRQYLQIKLAQYESEVFCCIFLDTQHRVIAFEELFYGTIDAATVYPRQVVKRSLHHNAAAVIFSHNHPSGIAEPSNADQMLTKRLKDALNLVDIRVLDHIVVGGTKTISFAESGLL